MFPVGDQRVVFLLYILFDVDQCFEHLRVHNSNQDAIPSIRRCLALRHFWTCLSVIVMFPFSDFVWSWHVSSVRVNMIECERCIVFTNGVCDSCCGFIFVYVSSRVSTACWAYDCKVLPIMHYVHLRFWVVCVFFFVWRGGVIIFRFSFIIVSDARYFGYHWFQVALL